jgi:hypothetical protein
MTRNQNEVKVLTEQEATALAVRIKAGVDRVRAVSVATAEDAMQASFSRAMALREFYAVLNRPDVQAFILLIGREFKEFEIADSKDYYMPDGLVIQGAIEALKRGLLLSHEAGPMFTLISGKGGAVSVLIKENGLRYKLRQIGASDVRASALSLGLRQRPNNASRSDMVLIGTASCTVNGQQYKVERTKEAPLLLPAYESDTPDKTEAQARRRLLRDLWVLVSGECDGEDDEQPERVQQVETIVARIPEQQISPQALYEGTRSELVAYATGIQDDGMRIAFQSILDCIEQAEDVATLRARWQPEILPVLQQLQVAAKIRKSVEKLCQQRAAVLEAS